LPAEVRQVGKAVLSRDWSCAQFDSDLPGYSSEIIVMLNEVKHLYGASSHPPAETTFGSVPAGGWSAERPAGAIAIANSK
jgi:hypothetical protein